MTDEDSIGVWVADMERAQAREIIDEGVNAVFSALDWMSDSETLLVTLTSDERSPRPERARVPTGPVIQEAAGYEAPVRTYQDLLSDADDAAH